MSSFTKIFLPFLIASITVFTVFAQEDEMVFEGEEELNLDLQDSSYIKKKNYSKQWDYENYVSEFPAKKKSKWAWGIHGGNLMATGDVRADLGYGVGMTIQKGIGHAFSIRYQGLWGRAMGRDWKGTAVAGSPGSLTYRNYRTTYSSNEIQGVINLNNINWYKRDPKVIVYAFLGSGVATRFTQVDSLDADGNPYNYDQITPATDRSEKRRLLTTLRDNSDGFHESERPIDPLDINVKKSKIMPTISWGMGLAFNMGKVVDLTIEHKIAWHNDDQLDAYNTDRALNPTQNKDFMHYTNVGLQFKIGKRTEPLYWVNPLAHDKKELMELESMLNNGEFMKDGDEDGVLDIVDKDKNTPPNVAVDTRGIALDSDKDGIPDHLDNQPFSPVGSPVDKNGVALDTDRDGVPDIFDKESGTPEGTLADAKGYEIKGITTDGPTSFSTASAAEIIFFDLNSSEIKPEFYHVLFKIRDFMNENPNAKISIEGHTDNRAGQAYNDALAKRRSEEVVKTLNERFGIDKNRFVVIAKGEDAPLIPDLPATYNQKFEGSHYLNRRVEFRVIK